MNQKFQALIACSLSVALSVIFRKYARVIPYLHSNIDKSSNPCRVGLVESQGYIREIVVRPVQGNNIWGDVELTEGGARDGYR